MSNFRFDDHNSKAAPSSSQANDLVAEHFTNLDNEDNDANIFEDTYDGLGDQLEESGDNFNDDTFGGSGENLADSKPVGKDYDFFGQTARVSQVISQSQNRLSGQNLNSKIEAAQNHPQLLSRSDRTSYERPSKPYHVPEMRVDASIWGITPKRATPTPASGTPLVPSIDTDRRRMMSVEEIEASMLNQLKNSAYQHTSSQRIRREPLQRSQSTAPDNSSPHYSLQTEDMFYGAHRQMSLQEQLIIPKFELLNRITKQGHQETGIAPINSDPSKIFTVQTLDRHLHEQKAHFLSQNSGFLGYPSVPHRTGHQYQLTSLSDEEKAIRRMTEARREKRNRKIFLLSKGNGLMTPQDKNYINRIQLQQLVTATGNPNDPESDLNFTEDFYYQVHYQIYGGSCKVTGNNYLHQSGERYRGSRKPIRGFSSHLQVMEQQVQRAVEISKIKFKNKQGEVVTLGKMSYSSAKTPKPTLNIRCSENKMDSRATGITKDRAIALSSVNGSDRKIVLADIERVYSTLMQLEDHNRKLPRQACDNGSNGDLLKLQSAWQEKAQEMSSHLWRQLKVHEPIGATSTHPFIAFLSYGKGMKTVPRVFRHISHEQRTTILTMIILHLDQLDLVRQGIFPSVDTQLSTEIKEKIEQFSQSVMPSLFSHLNEAGLEIVTGILGLLLTINLDLIARTKIGITIITMILSRAELIKQAGTADEKQDWDHWISIYDSFFDILEHTLPDIFPGSINTDEDVYVWQFLAAIGIGASPMQQQRLVVAVKDRVMETVSFAKSLPPTPSNQRLANVNLFMRSIGLDVELLD